MSQTRSDVASTGAAYFTQNPPSGMFLMGSLPSPNGINDMEGEESRPLRPGAQGQRLEGWGVGGGTWLG